MLARSGPLAAPPRRSRSPAASPRARRRARRAGPQRPAPVVALDGLHLRVAADALADPVLAFLRPGHRHHVPFRQHAPPGPLAPGLLTTRPLLRADGFPGRCVDRRVQLRSGRRAELDRVEGATGPRQRRDDGLPRRALLVGLARCAGPVTVGPPWPRSPRRRARTARQREPGWNAAQRTTGPVTSRRKRMVSTWSRAASGARASSATP